MPRRPIDLESMTQEETAATAIDAMSLLPIAERVQVVLATFSKEDQEELKAWLE